LVVKCHPALDAGSSTLIYIRYHIDPGSKAGMTKEEHCL